MHFIKYKVASNMEHITYLSHCPWIVELSERYLKITFLYTISYQILDTRMRDVAYSLMSEIILASLSIFN